MTYHQNSSIFSNNSSNSNTIDDNYNNGPKSSVEYQFLQRYSLAVLFFATGGIDTWIYKLNFLSGVHECEGWYDIFVIDAANDVFPFGVICDGEPNYETTEIMEEDVWRGMRTVTAIVLPRELTHVMKNVPCKQSHTTFILSHTNSALVLVHFVYFPC